MNKFSITIIIISSLLSSCAQYEIESQNYQFNQGIGNINSQVLLLNAVRASKRYPLQFTYTNSYTGQGRYDGQAVGTFPFGPGVLHPIYSIMPTLKLNTGMNQLQVTDLNSTKAIQYLKHSLGGDDFRYYYIHSEDRNISLITLLLVDYIRIESLLFENLESAAKTLCKSERGDRYATEQLAFMAQCRYIFDFSDVKQCTKKFPIPRSAFGTQQMLIFEARYTGSECADRQIRYASYILQIHGFNIQGDPARQAEKSAGDAGPNPTPAPSEGASRTRTTDSNNNSKPADPPLGASRGIFYFANHYFNDKAKIDINASKNKRGQQKNYPVETPLDITFRSPESMVRFLGALISAQLRRDNPVVPTIYDYREKKEVPIFSIKNSNPILGEAAVAIRDSEGDSFYIAIPDRHSNQKDLTLETLSIVADVLSNATAQAEIPPVPNLTLKVSQ